MKTCPVAKALLINDHGELLLMRRSKTAPRRALEWDLPGGLVEEGEDFGEALSREIEEEAGLKINPSQLDVVYTKTMIKENINVVYIFFAAKVSLEKVRLSHEHDQFKWTPLERALHEIKYDLHRELISHVLTNTILPDLPT